MLPESNTYCKPRASFRWEAMDHKDCQIQTLYCSAAHAHSCPRQLIWIAKIPSLGFGSFSVQFPLTLWTEHRQHQLRSRPWPVHIRVWVESLLASAGCFLRCTCEKKYPTASKKPSQSRKVCQTSIPTIPVQRVRTCENDGNWCKIKQILIDTWWTLFLSFLLQLEPVWCHEETLFHN